MLYLLLKALHLIAMIAWMAALFYLPRLFVYHVDATPGSEKAETFKIMERRLETIIMTPAMLATWLFGLLTGLIGGWFTDDTYWLEAKFLLVLALTAFHGFCMTWRKAFALDRNPHPARFYRMMNEVPTLVMIAIVLLATLKPF